MTENVVQLQPHKRMTPEEALAIAARDKWSEVVIVGYHNGDPTLKLLTSHMSPKDVLWISELLRAEALEAWPG